MWETIETVNYNTAEITKEEAYDYGWDLAADFPSLNNVDVEVTAKNGEWLIEVQYYYEIDEVEESPSAEEEDEQLVEDYRYSRRA